MKLAPTNIVTISGCSKQHYYTIASKNEFFMTDYVKVEVCKDYLSITKPEIDYRGKVYKISRKKQGPTWFSFTIVNELLFPGHFEINEEDSTTDELIIQPKF